MWFSLFFIKYVGKHATDGLTNEGQQMFRTISSSELKSFIKLNYCAGILNYKT